MNQYIVAYSLGLGEPIDMRLVEANTEIKALVKIQELMDILSDCPEILEKDIVDLEDVIESLSENDVQAHVIQVCSGPDTKIIVKSLSPPIGGINPPIEKY